MNRIRYVNPALVVATLFVSGQAMGFVGPSTSPQIVAVLEEAPEEAPAVAPKLDLTRTTTNTPAGETSKEKEKQEKTAGHLFLIGDSYSALTSDTNAAFGLGLLYNSKNVDSGVFIQRGTTGTELSNELEFGNFMLNPDSASVSMHAEFTRWWSPWKHTRIGIPAYFSAGAASWSTDKSTKKVGTLGLGFGVGPAVQLSGRLKGTGNDKGVAYSLTAGFGLAGRVLAGDINDEPSFRKSAIGTRQKSFWGGEGFATIQVNQLKIGVAVTVLHGQVDGLTDGQIVPRVVLQVPLFTALKVTEEKPRTSK